MLSIKVENLSKVYQLGEVGTGTLSRDLERWYAKVRGKEDPFLRIAETNDRTIKGIGNIVRSLKDINFEIKEGDAVGIIGKNGAGKSTLLKILSKVTSPTTGNIKIKGRIAGLLEVGTGFHPELTGRENIFLNGAILGMRKKEISRKLDAIIDFSGVERYIDTPVKRYSSGMYVRLAFAIAAYLESEILIVDEVLAVGDAEFQKKCLGKIGEVSKGEGKTVLFVSHNMSAINALCKKCILLNKGQIEKFHGTRQVLDYYLKNKTENQNLSTRNDRGGNQALKLINVDFLDSTQTRKINNLTTGESVYLELLIKNQYLIASSSVEIALGINDSFDNRITLISNKLSAQNISITKKDDLFKLLIYIQKLPFVCGEFSVTTFISSNGIINDWIQDAFKLTIVTDSFFPQTLTTLDKGQGSFYLDYIFVYDNKICKKVIE